MTLTLYDTHPEVVINCTELDVCISSSFGGDEAYVPTYRQNCLSNYFLFQLQACPNPKYACAEKRVSKKLTRTQEILEQDSSYASTEKWLLLEKFYLAC